VGATVELRRPSAPTAQTNGLREQSHHSWHYREKEANHKHLYP
jgi:hypothetical protein